MTLHLVEDIELLFPIKFWQILFGYFVYILIYLTT